MNLFSPFSLAGLKLPNRVVLAPMTRSRALEGNVPNPIAATYYTQRASARLLITEASQVGPQGAGYIRTPGIYSSEQVAGWKTVTDSVHRAGGRIFLQLWHVGRVSHPDFHNGALPVAPSALPVDGEAFTPVGKKRIETPRALGLDELPGITAARLRTEFSGSYIVNGGYNADVGNQVIARGEADLVAFGSSFLANPDLPVRLQKNAALNAPDFATFFSGEEKGYVDYPGLPEVRPAAHAALGD